MTDTVATTGAEPALVAVKLAILPKPLAARPIDGVLLIQLNITGLPIVGLVKLTGAVPELLHTTWLAG